MPRQVPLSSFSVFTAQRSVSVKRVQFFRAFRLFLLNALSLVSLIVALPSPCSTNEVENFHHLSVHCLLPRKSISRHPKVFTRQGRTFLVVLPKSRSLASGDFCPPFFRDFFFPSRTPLISPIPSVLLLPFPFVKVDSRFPVLLHLRACPTNKPLVLAP